MIDKEARAVIRIPFALAGVVVALLINLFVVVWFGGNFQSEVRTGLNTLENGQREAKVRIDSLAERMYTQADAIRDREQTARTVSDHESRIRDLERARIVAGNQMFRGN
jgi:hypothetical protein